MLNKPSMFNLGMVLAISMLHIPLEDGGCKSELEKISATSIEEVKQNYERARGTDRDQRRFYDLWIKKNFKPGLEFHARALEVGPTQAYSEYLKASEQFHTGTKILSETDIKELSLKLQEIMNAHTPTLPDSAYILVYGSIPNGHANADSDIDSGWEPNNLFTNVGVTALTSSTPERYVEGLLDNIWWQMTLTPRDISLALKHQRFALVIRVDKIELLVVDDENKRAIFYRLNWCPPV